MATNPKSKPATVKSVTSAAASSVKNVASLAAQKNKVAPANQAAFNKGIQDLMKEEGQLAGMLGGLATAVGGGGVRKAKIPKLLPSVVKQRVFLRFPHLFFGSPDEVSR